MRVFVYVPKRAGLETSKNLLRQHKPIYVCIYMGHLYIQIYTIHHRCMLQKREIYIDK